MTKATKSKNDLAVIILAAGRGTRMRSALPKVMHGLAGRPLIAWLLATVQKLKPARVIVVIAPDMDDLRAAVAPAPCAVQVKALGTGDAVKAALPALKGFKGDVLILLGDMPLISVATLKGLIKARHRERDTGLAVLGAEYNPVPAFGRLVENPDGTLARIVEHKDATAEERLITLCNTGAFCVDGAQLAKWVGRINNRNAQKEFYITDLPAIAAKDGYKTQIAVTEDLDEVQGVNSRVDLAMLEYIVQAGMRLNALEAGVTMHDPASVYFSYDTEVGRDVVIEPNVFIGPGVVIGDGVTIRSFCHIESAVIKNGCSVGPFARLRPGAELDERVHIGNFVEIKNAKLGRGVKAGHLAYIGDAIVGEGTNYSCGAITANYDGANKHKTVIGRNVMVGSNVNLIAPVTIGDGAYLAAGSTITQDVPKDKLGIARARQSNLRKPVKKREKKD
ncbi:MAG: bifunctional UDP-N-acetylglucosamine diphosphorylase/glucosamine-1-phosphate N-acetyltransferase GlmU [Micavibrio aeruginosavorus]|uniref:Bifunctional protein GlmU n=1 Tax=Micavibrio aeruginosavorus TaxID=349221 RepID=A0A7T5R2Q1_9BACT|nr:MAG: bifunctional UDP-N-acetylglucosamine diphosphorylase/glucosamine-1-phosphate N-acetyltransferase GlmU [Micavibrio aeruginosavorus]